MPDAVFSSPLAPEDHRPFIGHSKNITCIEHSPDGLLLATGSTDGTIRFWDAETGQQVCQLTPATHPLHWLSFSGSGRLLGAICAEYRGSGHVFVWDVSIIAEKGPNAKIPLVKQAEYGVDWHKVPSGSYMVAFSSDDAMIAVMTPSRICVENIKTGDVITDVPCDDYSFDFLLSFTSNNENILFGCNSYQDRDVRSLELSSQRQKKLYLNLASSGELESKPAVCSRDGRLIAGVLPTSTGGIQVWDAETGQSMHDGPLLGHVNMSTTICFSLDGTHVIDASSLPRTICVWSTSTGELVKGPLYLGSSFGVSLMDCSPLNDRIACVSGDMVHVWNLNTGQICLSSVPDNTSEEKPLFLAEGGADVIQWFPDGSQFVTSSKNDDFIRTWDAKTGNLVSQFPYNGGSRIALSPDGALLAVGSSSWLGTVVLLDSRTGKEYTPSLLRTGTSRIHKLEFASHGMFLAIVAQDSSRLHLASDLLDDRKIDHVECASTVLDFTFSPDAQFIAYACADCISIYHIGTSAITLRLAVDGSGFNRSLSYAPDGKFLLDNHGGDGVTLWNLVSGQMVFSLSETEPDNSRLALSAFSPDGRTFLCNHAADGGARMCMFGMSDGKQLLVLQENRSVSALAFSPGGDKVVIGLEDGPLQLYDTATGQMILPQNDLQSAAKDLTSNIQSRRARIGLGDVDDESIMNMPATLSGAARLRSQTNQTMSLHQQSNTNRPKPSANNSPLGVLLRFASRLGFRSAHANGQERHHPSRMFKLISIAKSKPRNVAAPDSENAQATRRNSGSDSDSSSSHSVPVATQAQPGPLDPNTAADEERESVVSNHGALDVVRYCLCCPCGR
ncbi:YVTN repeat-like/Quino protein amine dehydrogenase [Coniophora puteana RWD-64-598 SS2]|uniref:YVTN repeat-like/Quino protein amine dehydrogenase n=1 Tax=Coniophora puteana (strain RWD-64-598) TaxID=741705 RepID=A0A5M3N047_CONPW|nr:YVTN repeat-like/Quino protein amine dehydrogenase [Coniophora puteana RWD-64-598 SS2]EIW84738.1 YVTN repeat-like/Quino protein amine dehydrogenase [Coniophora puteana RWD-64-598 SS2]